MVTFLWSTSFIIIKWGLAEIPAVTYAGLRYTLAFLCFLPFLLQTPRRAALNHLSREQWKQLFRLGIVYYTLTQGIMFIGLSLLPSSTVSLLLNCTPLLVAGMGMRLLKEYPTFLQWLGTAVFLSGILLYFVPFTGLSGQFTGIGIMVLGVIANAYSSVLGREVNKAKQIDSVIITAVSMGIGSVIMLAAGLLLYGVPTISATTLLYLLWLATVNTAFAFYLWNVTMQSLSAIESSIINGTMLVQITVLAWLFLGEEITLLKAAAVFVATTGAVLVQLKPKNHV